MLKTIAFAAALVLFASLPGSAQSQPSLNVVLNVKAVPGSSQLHWTITNRSPSAVYVYSYYLYGPAFSLTKGVTMTTLNTTPTTLEGSCPYLFPPVLLLRVPAGDYREGDFRDSQLENFHGKSVNLSIGVGLNPYAVVSKAAKLRNANNCKKSPYNAIVEWSSIVRSNSVQIP
jgi:hypothetical protein